MRGAPLCATSIHVEQEDGGNDIQLFYVDPGDLIESAALQFCAKHRLDESECLKIQSYHQEQCFDTVTQQQQIGNPIESLPLTLLRKLP